MQQWGTNQLLKKNCYTLSGSGFSKPDPSTRLIGTETELPGSSSKPKMGIRFPTALVSTGYERFSGLKFNFDFNVGGMASAASLRYSLKNIWPMVLATMAKTFRGKKRCMPFLESANTPLHKNQTRLLIKKSYSPVWYTWTFIRSVNYIQLKIISRLWARNFAKSVPVKALIVVFVYVRACIFIVCFA